ncbi:ATP-binding protein [Bacillus sp. IBL03825]|uniref:ATP-binding protein n=1 Tax=Bacillus sp. IBL03825 TaxID=2953580 RepID=UPI00280635ED|nr:ATP-binding protein [Bacillus sp. IBL03825]
MAGCYEKQSIVITTNLEFSRWNSIFHDERLTTAMINRLIHHSYLLIFTGESYRLKHSYMTL